MSDIFDYIDWRGDLSFSADAFNCVDGLIYSSFSYICPDELFENNVLSGKSLEDIYAYTASLSLKEQQLICRCENDLRLLGQMKDAPRYSDCKILYYTNILDTEREIQFAAYAIELCNYGILVVYRGTDHSLIGWKEDMNLAYLDTLPGQEYARDFLDMTAKNTHGPLYIVGHSKGGNLAMYAASSIDKRTQSRIKAVYDYDGPGFRGDFLKSEGYLNMLPRIFTYVPQSSVVGMLLAHEEPYQVVESTNVGLLQHDPYSWNVLGKEFALLDDVDNMSQYTSQTLHSWIDGLSDEQRELFVENVYNIISESQAETLSDLVKPANFHLIMKALSSASSQTKQIIGDTMSQLRKIAFRSRKSKPISS